MNFAKSVSIILLLVFSSSVFYAQVPRSNGKGRETSIPEEWKTAAGTGYIKMDQADVKETKSENFKVVASFAKGKSAKVVVLPKGADTKEYKLIVLFDKNVDWASPLRDNVLGLKGDAANSLLTKYKMSVSKYYTAEDKLDGMVIVFDSSNINVAEAAKEFSKLEGVSIVHLKAPKQ
jgi:hypothetical protein